MIKSQRTKRRKIRNDLTTFNNNLNKTNSHIELVTTDDELITRESLSYQSIQNNDKLVLGFQKEPLLSNVLPTPILASSTLTEIIDRQSESKIIDFITFWAIQYKIFYNVLSGLLSGLKT